MISFIRLLLLTIPHPPIPPLTIMSSPTYLSLLLQAYIYRLLASLVSSLDIYLPPSPLPDAHYFQCCSCPAQVNITWRPAILHVPVFVVMLGTDSCLELSQSNLGEKWTKKSANKTQPTIEKFQF